MQPSSKPLEQVIAAIESLDLDPIKFKLMDAEEGQGWSREQADGMEIAYKRFLTLLVKYPDAPVAPSKDIDKFWHGHILDTMKYADDCQRVFGYFLHHFPYFGMRGEQDAAALADAGATTASLYEAEFGESMPAAVAFCGAAKPAFCGAAKAAAFCGAAKTAAFCGAAKPAFCGAADKQSEAAFCGAARAAAFCGAAAQSTAAFCGAAKPAFCGAARPAFCGAAVSANFDAVTRPTLALAA